MGSAPGSPVKKKRKGNEMLNIRKQIALDFQRRNNVRIVYATQCDMNTRELVINVFNDGDLYPIFPNSGVIAAINVLRPDGKSSSFPAEITGVGEVTYMMTAWPVGVAGEVKMSLALYSKTGDRISTDPFTLYVAEGLYLGSQIEEDEENQTAFANLMAKLADFSLMEDVRVANEDTRKANEIERKRNENDRIFEEENRATAEYRRSNAENGRYNNELVREENEQVRIANEALRCQVTDALLRGLDNLLALQEEYINSIPGGES